MKYIVIASVIGLAALFFLITMNRFGGDNEYVNDSFIYDDAIFDNKILNSQLSYFSEWYIHTDKWLPKYGDKNITNGSRTFPVIAMLLSKLKLTDKYPAYMNIAMQNQFGDDQFTFLGIATCLAFDLGVFLTVIFIFIYYLVIRNPKLIYDNVDIVKMMLLTLLIQIPATGLFNSALNAIEWHFSLYIYIIFALYKKINIK